MYGAGNGVEESSAPLGLLSFCLVSDRRWQAVLVLVAVVVVARMFAARSPPDTARTDHTAVEAVEAVEPSTD